MLRLITDGKLTPEEAVRVYHGVLQGKGIRPHRSLEDDLKLSGQAMSCGGSTARRATVEARGNPLAKPASGAADWPKVADGTPDFSRMSSAQRLAYDNWRLGRKFA
jgi:hypothetical protein